MPLILGANSLAGGGYEIDNSLRFNDDSSDFLNRTPASSGNRKTWTWSSWVKKSTIGSGYQFLFSCTDDSTSTGSIGTNYNGDNTIYFRDDLISLNLTPNAVHRDVSAWYHIVVALDTTQATASDRAKMWINGEQITSFSTSTYPSQNEDGTINLVSGSYVHRIGTYAGTSNFFDGYLAETVFIDGTALDETSFGEFDSDSGIWKPIDVSGLTFGTNGFYLEFKDSSALGDDTSNNSNDFTVNNLTSIDQTTDTPTNNFSTLSPLWNSFNQGDLSEGNLKSSMTSGAYKTNLASFGVSQGKWYWEIKLTQASDMNFQLYGVTDESTDKSVDFKASTGSTVYNNTTGKMQIDGSEPGSASAVFAQGDIVGIALNMDDKEISIYKNGSALHSDVTMSTTSNLVFPCHIAYTYSTYIFEYNFGNPPFAITTGNADANNFGNFEYAVPSGYYALNTKNLAEYG
jgi:hypothetical protein